MPMQSGAHCDRYAALQGDASTCDDAGTCENERLALARELHDTVIQPLTSLLLSITRLEYQQPSTGEVERHLDMWKGLAREALDSLRASLAGLQTASPRIDDLPGALCCSLVRQVTAHGLQLSVECHHWPADLPPAWNSSLYLAVREAVTNVQKHAQASRVSVVLGADAEELAITITDDGVGLAQADLDGERCTRPGYGLGISSIRDRVAVLSGRMNLTSGGGKGVQVEIRLPRPPLPSPADCRAESATDSRDISRVTGRYVH